jgi:hypothetical protein
MKEDIKTDHREITINYLVSELMVTYKPNIEEKRKTWKRHSFIAPLIDHRPIGCP